MPAVFGLTGGIGAGKSKVASFFEEEGVPVYNSDLRAKWLMANDPYLKSEIIICFGVSSYNEEGLNRPYLAQKVFKDKKALSKLNALVHPAVAKDFDQWCLKQDKDFVIKEAAILFESGAYKQCDYVICVMADQEIRINRVMQRDGVNREQVLDRMSHQWSDTQRQQASDYLIWNNGSPEELKESFFKLYSDILTNLVS